MKNIGVIGCGSIAKSHLKALLGSKDFRLYALCDVNEERLREFAEKYKPEHTYTDYQKMLDNPEIDAVSVCTIADMHFPIVIEAAAKGKHVLCEKPIADTLEKGYQMVDAMEKSGKTFAINLIYRQSHNIEKVQTWIKTGKIGKLYGIKVTFMGNGPAAGMPELRKRLDDHMIKEHGVLCDCGVHMIDMVRMLSESEFKKIIGTGMHVQGFESPDHALMAGYMENGVYFSIEESYVFGTLSKEKPAVLTIEIFGEKGCIRVGYDYLKKEMTKHLYTPDGTVEETDPHSKGFDLLYSRFAESIRNGKLTGGIASGKDACIASEVAHAATDEILKNISPLKDKILIA